MGKKHTDVDREKFLQYKKDHPEIYYPHPELQQPAKLGYKFTLGAVRNTRYWLKRFLTNYGMPFFVTLGSTYIGVKGYLYSCINQSQAPYYIQYLKIGALDVTIFMNIASGPWSMKGFMGVLSDLVPIAGYKKCSWCFLAALMGSICWVLLAFVPVTKDTAMIAAIFYFFANVHIANNDVLVEGQYAELMRRNPMSGPDIVTWVWVGYFIGGMINVWTVALLAFKFEETQEDKDTYPDDKERLDAAFKYIQYIMIIAIPFAVQNTVPFIFNWLGETRLPVGERGFQRHMWQGKNRNLYLCALCLASAAVFNVIANVINGQFKGKIADLGPTGDKLQMMPLFGFSILLGAFLIWLCFRLLPEVVAKANTYFFMSHALYVSPVVDAWYLKDTSTSCVNAMALEGDIREATMKVECCLPETSPQLSQWFMTGTMGTFESLFGGIGVALFQAIMGDWTLRPCFWVTTLIKCIGSLWDCFIFLRWNKKIGINDEFALVLGNAVVREIVSMMDFMPGVVLISKLCPVGAESTMYAIMAGFSNFGRAVGRNFGAVVLPLFSLKITHGGECNDDNLALVVFLGQFLMPLFSIPLTWWLIPDARLTGTIVDRHGNIFPPPEEDDIEAEFEEKEATDGMYIEQQQPDAYQAPEPQFAPDVYSQYSMPAPTPVYSQATPANQAPQVYY